MSQSLDGHPNQGSSSSSVKSMGSRPPVVANSLSAPNSTSYPGTETPIINSQNRGYEESQDGLPASLSQEGVSDRGGQSDLTLGDLARQTKLLASHYDKLSGHVAIFGRRLHDLHDAINLVMERQSPEDHNNPRSFATDPAKWAHDADFYGIYLWFLRSERDHGRRIEPGDSPLAEAYRFRYTFDSLYHDSNPVRPQTLYVIRSDFHDLNNNDLKKMYAGLVNRWNLKQFRGGRVPDASSTGNGNRAASEADSNATSAQDSAHYQSTPDHN
ncbi:uncharacterized protein BKA55DRAFT_738521 [Fusarium redolens]|uniref:Uncharacterized protein n=1 Tax=Fusarium redolens TaxID=48865 RepID=A0A9P9H4F3_FUSRE|nr:uncharacterized protein BKA55DRAFT_738521 [Fusarium redolens]KAH7250148.1 hypothetical protein BKA55DRAFT_738521 [Fusarium redolens]